MWVPVLNKVLETSESYVERLLPVPGTLFVNPGDNVVPYSHLGFCSYSQKTLKLPAKFRPVGYKKDGQFYYIHNNLGKSGRLPVEAPYNGNLFKMPSGEYEFRQEVSRYTLLSGVWGIVDKVVDKKSLLIKTTMKNLNLVIATKTDFAGELVVFPNPSHLLEKFYLDEFTKGSGDGKVVYIGNQISINLLKQAVKYGVKGIVGGSADLETYKYALKSGISFGLFSGFGNIPTPEDIYTVLTGVSNRYVFFKGEQNVLSIPMPPEEQVQTIQKKLKQPIVDAKKGMRVLILQHPHFGESGTIDSLTENSIFVKFNLNDKAVEIRVPNFYILNVE